MNPIDYTISPNLDFKFVIKKISPLSVTNFEIYKECLLPYATRNIGVLIENFVERALK